MKAWTQTRVIMGRNFFGIEEANKYFQINPSKQQIATLAEVPFSEETLRACNNTHVLAAVFPLSILDIRDICSKIKDRTLFRVQNWYERQPFAKDEGGVGWQLVRKKPIADSALKTWNEQQVLLTKDEETPKAQIVVYTIIGHYLATGERLCEHIDVRCVDLDSDGLRTDVGHFGDLGLGIRGTWDDTPGSVVGLSAAKKRQTMNL